MTFPDCARVQKSWLFIHYIEKRGEVIFLLVTIIYIILRTTLDNGLYSVMYDKTIGGIRGTFSLNSNSNRTSTVLLLTDSSLSRAVNDY